MWKMLSSKVAYKNPYFHVREDAVIRPDGSEGAYYVLENGSGIIIVPISSDKEIYLVGQHRYPTGTFSWEVPAGAHEGGDDLDNAKRELREETGLVSEAWTKLADVHVMNGTANFKVIVFLAEHVQETGEHAQSEEGITDMRKETFQRTFDLIRSGEMTDSESISAITLAALHLKIV